MYYYSGSVNPLHYNINAKIINEKDTSILAACTVYEVKGTRVYLFYFK